MGEQAMAIVTEVARQFPVVVLTLGVGWYFMRYISKQHARELQAKNEEIQRLIERHQLEFERLDNERKQYYKLFLKEIEPYLKKRSGPEEEPPQKPKAK